MAREVWPRGNELFQRREDVAEIDIGDEAVDAGVDAGRGGASAAASRATSRPARPPLPVATSDGKRGPSSASLTSPD